MGDIDDEDVPSRPDPKSLETSDVSSIFDLRNELIKRKQDAAVKKSAPTNEYAVYGKAGGVLSVKKDEKSRIRTDASDRKRRIAEHERVLREEENARLAKSAKRMQEKSELYDKLQDGITFTHKDDTPVEFMVDFQMKKKQYEEESDRRCGVAVDNYDQLPGTSDETPVVEHYNPEEERRVYGVSHMKFAQEEEKRQEQIKELYDLSDQTEKNRLRRQELLKKREDQKKEKLAAMRRRLGLPAEEKEAEPDPPVYLDIPLPVEVTVEDQFAKRIKSNREWDRGKDAHTEWITKQRNEREDEFRPPDFYYK